MELGANSRSWQRGAPRVLEASRALVIGPARPRAAQPLPSRYSAFVKCVMETCSSGDLLGDDQLDNLVNLLNYSPEAASGACAGGSKGSRLSSCTARAAPTSRVCPTGDPPFAPQPCVRDPGLDELLPTPSDALPDLDAFLKSEPVSFSAQR